MSEKRITRRAPGQQRKGKTNWKALHRLSDERAEAAAAADIDNPPWSQEELRSAELAWPTAEPKVPVSIRLDREVLDYFKADGPGYQSRISAVLRSYVRSRRATD
ncbi:MAG: BrnA antitoxin family protein [Gemmatimonadetes bacterium]|nr:BrnA antitoxin family protein [Gemmatimonadota bacterium]